VGSKKQFSFKQEEIMVKTNRAQREALFKVFQRDFPGWLTPTKRIRYPDLHKNTCLPSTYKEAKEFAARYPHLMAKVPSIQYRRFRKKVQPFFGGDCVMVPYAGMWLGIERDGYTHS
jgi:hypothetical protein